MTLPIEGPQEPAPIKRSAEFYCKARKSDGTPCRAYAIKGGSVCRVHGGSAPAVRDAARRRAEVRDVEKNAAAVLAAEGFERIFDPVEALAELASRISGTERALAARVNALQDLSYRSLTGTEQMRAEIVLWGNYQDRLAKILEALGKFNLDERRVRVTELQSRQLVEALERIFDRLGLTTEQRSLLPVVVPEELRRLVQ
ncbi:HGGxSTG domain-containing protein [Pseudarthrobacter sp. NPDC092439]|uniref:HGGxSTG domain-containing protein n=1 Tax=unclassified Pseudarthrobacter TaxID=2647000 RepID=UPI00381CDF95